MADSPKHNVVNPRRRGRGRGRGRARARGLSQGTQLFESQPQGHGRKIQYLATASTVIEPRPGQASRDVTVEDEVQIHNDKVTVADMATQEQGKVSYMVNL